MAVRDVQGSVAVWGDGEHVRVKNCAGGVLVSRLISICFARGEINGCCPAGLCLAKRDLRL